MKRDKNLSRQCW